jgi:hypothetical protein
MLPGSDIDPDHKLLVSKICNQLKKNLKFPKRETKMSFGEFTWATAGSARYSRKLNSVQSHMKAGMWKRSGTVSRNM